MTPKHAIYRMPGSLLLALTVAIFSPCRAQVAAASTASAADLAKHDTNKNGRLDPAELNAMQADRARAVPTTTAAASTAGSEPVVQLSPFEVVSDTKGYYSSNTMSGTRFNSKIEDLGASITVVTK